MFLKYTKYRISEKSIEPRLLIKLGILTVVIVAVGLAALFQIPVQEKIFGKVELYGFGESQAIRMPSDGQINFLIKAGNLVKSGEAIATIDWNVTTEVISKLEELSSGALESNARLFDFKLIEEINWLLVHDLKQLKIPILSLIEGIQEYHQFVLANDPEVMIQNLSERLSINQALDKEYGELLDEALNQHSLLHEMLKRDSLLAQQGSLAATAFDKQKSSLIDNEIKMYDIKLARKGNSLQNASLLSEIEILRNEFKKRKLDRLHGLRASLREIKAQFYLLSKDHILFASRTGIVSMPDNIRQGDRLNQGDPVMYLIPEGGLAENFMFVPVERAKDIKDGMKVLIVLDDYAPQNIGYISATVREIADIPLEGWYRINLDLSYPLVSSFGQLIQPKVNLSGQGRVLTNRYSLFRYITRAIRYEINKIDPK